ncbi:MAG: hypothetical protein ACP5RH_17875 [Leptodesmis sp.]
MSDRPSYREISSHCLRVTAIIGVSKSYRRSQPRSLQNWYKVEIRDIVKHSSYNSVSQHYND